MIIPTHNFIEKKIKEIKVNQLSSNTHYNYGEPHRHDYFEFFVFLKGGGFHSIDFEKFPIRSNSIHIVAPGQVHQVERTLNSGGFVMLFNADLFESDSLVSNFLFDHICHDVHEFSPTYTFNKSIQIEVLKIIQAIWKDYNSSQPLKNEFLAINLNLLCIYCMRSLKDHLKENESSDYKIYTNFRRTLLLNFRETKKVKEYADKLNISSKKLNEIVKIKTGELASVIIYKQIILEAKRLLNTGISVKEIAFMLHFEYPAHFSKFFKSQTGISPSQF